MSNIMPTYAPQDVSFVRGSGAWLFDSNGKQYLDALSGVAVCGLGYNHPAVSAAIHAQADSLLHCSNLFRIEQQEQLAKKLCAVSGMDNVFFCNSGAEANEAAIKLARLYGHKVKNVKSPAIVVMEGAFHGRTMATLSASGSRKIQAGFEPLVGGFVRAPFDDLAAVKTIAQNNADVVAVLVEPAQGESGIRVPSDDYLPGLKEICESHGWLLMLDEVQTGNGRTGEYFACQHKKVQADVMTSAKGLGNGVPIGACLTHGRAAELMSAGSHGSTFGGNPLASAAALAVLESLEKDNLVARAASLGKRIRDGLQPLLDDGLVADIRHKGLMFGIDLGVPCTELVAQGLKRGVVVNVTADSVLRLLPPLILSDDEADQLVAHVCALVKTFSAAAADASPQP